MSESHDVTDLLGDWGRGDRAALDRLMPLVQGELRTVARGYLRKERPDHTLQTTALINEAYLRLVGQARVNLKDRGHFFAIASQMMRRVLVDHARRKRSQKRGADVLRVTLNDAVQGTDESTIDVLALNSALEELAHMDPRQVKIVELRFFGGLSVEEAAAALEISTATVKREWAMSKAWLFRKLRG